jgi:hypothetical protein
MYCVYPMATGSKSYIWPYIMTTCSRGKVSGMDMLDVFFGYQLINKALTWQAYVYISARLLLLEWEVNYIYKGTSCSDGNFQGRAQPDAECSWMDGPSKPTRATKLPKNNADFRVNNPQRTGTRSDRCMA